MYVCIFHWDILDVLKTVVWYFCVYALNIFQSKVVYYSLLKVVFFTLYADFNSVQHGNHLAQTWNHLEPEYEYILSCFSYVTLKVQTHLSTSKLWCFLVHPHPQISHTNSHYVGVYCVQPWLTSQTQTLVPCCLYPFIAAVVHDIPRWLFFCSALSFLNMGGSDCDRYDGWIDESLPLLLERFKI